MQSMITNSELQPHHGTKEVAQIYDAELKVMLHAIKEAGDRILALQQKGLSISRKINNTILTEADLEADQLLKSHLLKTFPQYGWLSEETMDDESRLSKKHVWVVDPIDGTKEYAAGLPEYAVSIALIEDYQPVLASVYNPAKKQLFHAIRGKGAWLNETKIKCSNQTNIILVSRSEYERGEWNHFQSKFVLKQMGSIAYKLALVAVGEALATLTYQPRSEWDIAAGVLLIREAGGEVTNKLGQPFLFNQSTVLVNGVLANKQNLN